MKSFKIACAIFLTSLIATTLTTCGGGGGNSGNGFDGNESNISSAVTVVPTQTTDSSGTISIATSNTSKLTITVNDTSSGSTIPIADFKVNITTDKGNYIIYLDDPSGVIPPLPIAFNVNDVYSSSTKSIAKISAVGDALSCGLQAGEAIFSYAVSILGEEIKVLVNLMRTKDIFSIIENAPIAFKGTSNFQKLDDNSLTGRYRGRYTLKEAIQALEFELATTKTILALSTVALSPTGAPAAVTKLAGVVVSTNKLLLQLESVMYCFYGYNDNYKFDWYLKYGTVLVPVPVDPNSQNPVIASLTANTSTLIPNGTTSITCNAYDVDNNPLKYYWSITKGGNISGSGPTVNWTAPSSVGIYTVSCSVSNGKSISSQNIDIEVIPSSPSLLTINFVTISPQILYPGDSFMISYNVTNSGSSANYAILGASIGPSGTSVWPISDSVNDAKVSLTPGTSSVSRQFTIPSYISPPDTYDLLVGLWQDANNNNVIDSSIDTLLNSKANRPALTIWSRIAGTKPASFTLSFTDGCNGSSPENLLSWTASSGAVGYYAIYRCTGSNCTPTLYWQNATSVPYTTFRNTSVTAGTTYTYFIRASNSYGYTDSNWITVTTRSNCGITLNSPAPPSNLSVTALSQNNIALTWQDNSNNETGFRIERKTGTSGSFSQIATTGAVSGSGSGGYYEDTGLTAGTTYCYRAQAYNSTGNSSYSNESCATTNANVTLPTATTGSATNITSSSATLNGIVNPNGLATGAFFQWGTSTSFGNTTPSQVLGSGTSNVNVPTNLTGLSSNTAYYFRIVATNSAGGTTFGATLTFTTSGSTQQIERLTNSSFSSGASGWTLVGDFWAGTNLTNYRTSPGYAAGGVDSTGTAKNNAVGYMYQAVAIPSNAASATLSFWYNITSQETVSVAYDVLNVTIQDSAGNYLATVAVLSNLYQGAVGVYNQVIFDATPYRGQTIRVNFLATTDVNNTTVFRIDDVSLMSDG